MSDHLTKNQLIELLSSFDGDPLVWIEGCDCTGKPDGVILDEDGHLLITRPDGEGVNYRRYQAKLNQQPDAPSPEFDSTPH